MNRRILKFAVPPGVTEIATEDEPRFLAVGVQNGNQVVVWCEATPGAGVNTRLAIALTGESVPDDADYIGTTQFTEWFDRADIGMGGTLIVVHVYRQRSA